MRNMLPPLLALLLSSCASNPPPASLPSRSPLPLPSIVMSPPSASTEGALLGSLENSLSAMQRDLTELLQSFHNDTLKDLGESLGRARQSPPPSGRAAPSR